MDTFIKATGGILIAVILILMLGKKEYSLMISIAVCAMVSIIAIGFLDPVIGFFSKLQTLGQFDSQLMQIVLRCVGIGILSEITSVICTDAGNAALGKTIQILGCCVILWLSLPLFTNLIELVEEILLSV